MILFDNIAQLHIEITERCQAACLMCARNDNPGVTNAELTLEDIVSFIPTELYKQLNLVSIIGNYGDPIIAKDLLPVIKHFKQQNPFTAFQIHSNAGARSVEFWQELANLLPLPRDKVVFGIDGLEDTFDIYRVNVRWDHVMRSAKAFIDAGGNARWDFISFNYNQHQISQARELADKMGFKQFNLKKSNRFLRYQYDGLSIGPSDKYYNNEINDYINKSNQPGFFDNVEIDCMALREQEVYISAKGMLLPCCYIAQDLYEYRLRPDDKLRKQQAWELLGHQDNVDLRKKQFKDIIDSEVFKNVHNSWSKNSIESGRLKVCAQTCNKLINFYGNNFYFLKDHEI